MLAVLTAAVPASSSTGVRSARDDLRAARAQLRALDLELSIAAERLHEGKVLLATLRSDLAAARARAGRATSSATDAADAFDAMVRQAYENGISSQLAVLGLGSVGDLSQGVDLLSAMASNQEQVAANASDARDRAAEADGQTSSLEAQVTTALAGQRAAATDLNVAAARQKTLISDLERRLHRRIKLAIVDRRAADAAQSTPPAPTTGPAPTGTSAPSRPLPRPSEPAPTTGEVVALISSLWGDGPDEQVARCVAWRESRYQATARNSSSGAGGLFQLMPFWWDGNNEFGWRFDPYDAHQNAVHAHLIWRAYGWEPWTTGHLCV